MAVYSAGKGTQSTSRAFLESPAGEQWGVLAARLVSTVTTTAAMGGDRGNIGRATGGTTPTAYTPELFNTRSPAAPDSSTLFTAWGTAPTIPGDANTLVIVSVLAGREDMYGFPWWRPGRSAAIPLAQDGERLDFRQAGAAAGETCDGFYLAGHLGAPPPPGRFAGRRPRTRGDWVYSRSWQQMTAGADTLARGLRQITWGAALQLPRSARYVPDNFVNVLGGEQGPFASGDATGQQHSSGDTAVRKQAAGAVQGATRVSGATVGAKNAAGAVQGPARTAGVAAVAKQAIGAAVGQQRSASLTAGAKGGIGAAVGNQRNSGLSAGTGGAPPAFSGAATGQQRASGISAGSKLGIGSTSGQARTSAAVAGIHQGIGGSVGQQRTASVGVAAKGAAGAAVGTQRVAGSVATIPAVNPGRGTTRVDRNAAGTTRIDRATTGGAQVTKAASGEVEVD